MTSFAAALRLRQFVGPGLEVNLSSKNRILKDLRLLHAQWIDLGRRGLESITILGVLAPVDLNDDLKTQPGEIRGIFKDFTDHHVRMLILNEFVPFELEDFGTARFEHSPKEGEGLVGAIERICGEDGRVPEDPFKLGKILKESIGVERRNLPSIYLVLEWLFVEVMQNWDQDLLREFVAHFANMDAIPDPWARRAKMQRGRGREIIVGDIYRNVLDRIKSFATSDIPVLILGPSGTGKELIARHIHYTSSRRMEELVTESCANLPDNLFEAEIFGSVAGAFTGAVNKDGLVKRIDGGTLFLDEIGELSKVAQGKLLRFVQDGTYRKVGGTTNEKPVSVRIIAATNEDLYAKVRKGEFRADLWHRLCGEVLDTPALAGNEDSIRRIAIHQAVLLYDSDPELLKRRKEAGVPLRLDESQIPALLEYSWPGNVRELRQAIYRHLVTGRKLTEIVRELKTREEKWLQGADNRPADTYPPFVVREPMTTQALVNAYALWARGRWPEMTQEELSQMLGSTTKTLRRRMRSAARPAD